MRIAFVVESLILTGGLRAVFEQALRLRQRGHEVTLLAPRPRLPRALSIAAWKPFLYERLLAHVEDGLRTYGLEDRVVRFDPARPEEVPAFDVIIATAWPTAEWVHAMPSRVGVRYYYIMGYEAWREQTRERVDRTWKLPLRKLVVAHWLERLARERFGETVHARIPNGVDIERFRPVATRAPGPLRVGMLYELAHWKGADDGIQALWTIHRAEPAVEIVLFGRNRVRQALPRGARFIRNSREAEMPGVYQGIDLFVNSSHSEGFSLVTLEAMASGCALVATAVGEVPVMGVPDRDYVMVPAHDPAALAARALELLRDPERLRRVALAGRELAQRYTWDHAAVLLDRALRPDAAPGPDAPRDPGSPA